jgi:fermentation-respiration switch protein FrsA (DUF1100 family)
MAFSLPPLAVRALQLCGGLLLLYGALRFLEWKMIYFPRAEVEATPDLLGLKFEDITFIAEDGVKLNGWWVPHAQARGTLLHCHGNAGNLGHRVELAARLHQLGVNVFLFDYRGYGKSCGRPSERGLARDARAAYEFVRAQYGDAERPPILLHGQSLGGAVAAQLALEKKVRGLILESAFTSVPDMARQLYPGLPLHRLIMTRFDTLAHVTQLTIPKLIAHSPDDEVVPFEMGRRLFAAAAPPKQFVALTGGHNDGLWTPEYERALHELLAQTLGPAAK